MREKGPYVGEPEVPGELKERHTLVMAVLRGEMTVTAAARQLNVSRNHFQTLLHKAQAGLIAGLEPGLPGRPPLPVEVAELRQRMQQLERENAQLRQQAERSDKLMEAVGGILQGRAQRQRSARKKRSESSGGANEGEDPDGARQLEEVERMRALGLTTALAAAAVGVAASTARRWRRVERCGQPLRSAGCDRRAPVTEETRTRVIEVVKRLHGQIGAEALSHRVPELSRRQAAELKQVARREMEKERIARLQRITVTESNVIRGMDQLYVRCGSVQRLLLLASDAHVPYRTSVTACSQYDEEAVLRALQKDLARYDAPLVYRLDRASSHRTPRVKSLLDAHQVLVLHGPAHYPQYYGQLERQNREHRAWLRADDHIAEHDLQCIADKMLEALNHELPRKSHDWHTASEIWMRRSPLAVERNEFREDVTSRAARLRLHVSSHPDCEELAWRLAIEQALKDRGYLLRQTGGWC
jgi:transposase-like protein